MVFCMASWKFWNLTFQKIHETEYWSYIVLRKLFQLNDQIWTSFKLSFGLAASAIIIQGYNRGKSPLTFCDVDRFLWLYLSYIDDIFFLKWFELVVVFTLLSKETGYLNIPKRKWKGNLFIETLWLKLLKDSWVKVMMNKFLLVHSKAENFKKFRPEISWNQKINSCFFLWWCNFIHNLLLIRK